VALAGRAPIVAGLLAEFGPPVLPAPTDSHFATLVRSIVYQQLAGRAAAAIHGRLIAALDGEVTPDQVLASDPTALRAAGLSANKLASLLDLATKVADGTVVLDARRLGRASDDEIVAQLTTVRGIGKWSAEMFLMFHLRRLDVWPTGDLGVRKGFGIGWGLAATPTPKALEALGDPFRPYRSVVAWYCWRVVHREVEATR
jgi:DNA-3-methyladenine glycosylase II